MSLTSVEIDDELVGRVMQALGVSTRRTAVHVALERVLNDAPMSVGEQLAMRGTGWPGDLATMRADPMTVDGAVADR